MSEANTVCGGGVESPHVDLIKETGTVNMISTSTDTFTCSFSSAGIAENVEPVVEIEFVDLGLASGTLWMKYNIGAANNLETDYGKYFQWGDTVGYTDASHSTWATCPFNGGASDYDSTYWAAHKSEAVDSDNILLPANDCVYQATNGAAKLPTKAQIDELCALSTKSWKTNYNGTGVNGFEFRGNGNTLFIPAAGYTNNGYWTGVTNYSAYWSSSFDTNDCAWRLMGYDNSSNSCSNVRLFGCSARGVKA